MGLIKISLRPKIASECPFIAKHAQFTIYLPLTEVFAV